MQWFADEVLPKADGAHAVLVAVERVLSCRSHCREQSMSVCTGLSDVNEAPVRGTA